MEIKDIKPNQGNIDVTADMVSKDEPRSFEKFGKVGRVCNAQLKDNSGEIKLTLWNDEVDAVKVGDSIHIQGGWCSEYKGERQLSAGKFGKMEVVGKATISAKPTSASVTPTERKDAGAAGIGPIVQPKISSKTKPYDPYDDDDEAKRYDDEEEVVD